MRTYLASSSERALVLLTVGISGLSLLDCGSDDSPMLPAARSMQQRPRT